MPLSKPLLDAVPQAHRIGDEQIVADQLHFRSQRLGECQPALHIEDEIPFQFVSSSTQKALSDGRGYDFEGSIFAFSQTWPGRVIDHVVVQIVPAVTPETDEFPLGLEPGTPYIMLLETHYTDEGEPVAFSRVHVDDHFIRFSVVRHN